MRIAFLNSIEAETFGGMEQWIRLVSDGLLKRDHQVWLIGRSDSKFLERVSREVPGVQTRAIDISGDFNPFTISALRRFLRENQIDLLCVNFNKDVRLGGIAARLNGKVKVVWSVGINIAKDKFSHRVLTPRLIDRVIVPSDSLKSEITQYGYVDRSVVEVIPIGIDDRPSNQARSEARKRLQSKYNLPDNAVVAVTVGRLVYKKGHEYLIEAAPQIIGRIPAIRFLFLGDGPKEAVLKRQVEQLSLSKHFVFAGMLDSVDLELNGADIMIHPSKEEPFGIALLEGMRAGLPIIASRVGGIPEVVADGETAMLFEPRNPSQIAHAATQVLTDSDLMKRLGRNGRERWSREFQYDTMIDRVESSLMSVVSPEYAGSAKPSNIELQSAR